MSSAAKALKKILDLLPLNGSKLSFGALLILLGQLPYVIPGLNLIDIIQQIIANPTRAGIIAALIGALHKVLKLTFPDLKV